MRERDTTGEAAEFSDDLALTLAEQLDGLAGRRGVMSITMEGESVGLAEFGKLCTLLNKLLREIERSQTGKRPAIHWIVDNVGFVENTGKGAIVKVAIRAGVKPRPTRERRRAPEGAANERSLA